LSNLCKSLGKYYVIVWSEWLQYHVNVCVLCLFARSNMLMTNISTVQLLAYWKAQLHAHSSLYCYGTGFVFQTV